MSKKKSSPKPQPGSPLTEGCQLKCVPSFEEKDHNLVMRLIVNPLKKLFAKPWNRHLRLYLKKAYYSSPSLSGNNERNSAIEKFQHVVPLQAGDFVMVRVLHEIESTLDPFMELRGCAFLEGMKKYCGTSQRVLRPMRYFMDERDYRRKRTRGLILLENVICEGTPVFGSCDRCCFLFWREEWLEKI